MVRVKVTPGLMVSALSLSDVMTILKSPLQATSVSHVAFEYN